MHASPALTLMEELLLLAAHDEKGTLRGSGTLTYGLAGAGLLELASLGRIHIRDDFLEVVDGKDLPDPLLQEMLEVIRSAKRRRKLKAWIQAMPNKVKRLPHRVGERLVERGVLKLETGRVLGLFPYVRYPEQDPRPEQELHQRIRRAVFGSRKLDPRTGTLVALMGACGLTGAVFEKERRREASRRIKEITEHDLYGTGVAAAIREVQAAVLAVIIASSAASHSATH